MAEVRLLASAASYFLVATLWGYVGLRILRRPRGQGAPARATLRFGAWWLGLAGHSVVGGLLALAGALGHATTLVVALATYAAALCIGAMLWGLVSYLAYLYAGRPGVLPAVTVAYALQTAGLVAAVWWLQPIGMHVDGWTPMIDYAKEAGAGLDAFVGVTFLLPPLVASAAYLALLRRVADRTRRYRVLLVGGSILGWTLASIVLNAAPGTSDVGNVVGRLLAFGAPTLVVLAYDPPAWVQRRFRVERLGEEVQAPPPTPGELAERREAIRARVRDLV